MTDSATGAPPLKDGLAVVGGCLAVCVVVWLTGAAASPLSVFLPLLPLLAACLSGARAAILACVVVVAALAALAWLPAAASRPAAGAAGLGWLAVAVVAAAGLGVLYEQRRAAAEHHLRRESLDRQQQAATEREAMRSELRAKDADLERFTYAVSHDLKSPMTAIYGFLRVLQRDIETGNSERIDRHIAIIQQQVDRMAQQTDDLLELARIGNGELSRERLKVTEVAREAAELVERQLAESRVEIDIAPDLPSFYADRTVLRLIFQNLIENGAKCCAEASEPRVRIGWRRLGEESVVFVHDNGVGIAAEHRERVFEALETSHPEINGSGIGLANAKRAVDVHGGRIWVESDSEARGSTIFFTIPNEPAADREAEARQGARGERKAVDDTA